MDVCAFGNGVWRVRVRAVVHRSYSTYVVSHHVSPGLLRLVRLGVQSFEPNHKKEGDGCGLALLPCSNLSATDTMYSVCTDIHSTICPCTAASLMVLH